MGASGYAVTSVFSNDNNPLIRLRGEYSNAYAILGELYLKVKFGNTELKIGRQELNTPFADMDDGGMVPNTFEALSVLNTDVENLEISWDCISCLS